MQCPDAARRKVLHDEPAAAQASQAPDGQAAGGGELATVKQKIFWNIQKGEVACRVNESEFIRYDSAQGLIVNDGTTAYIKANGKVLAEIHGGIYDFVDPDELKRVLESRTGGAAGLMAGSGRFLINALLGRRVKDKFDDKDAPERQRSLDAVIESMKRHEAFSLLLKLDKSFSLVFGSGTAEDMAEFRPMSVRTKLLDLQVGLRVIFRIADFNRFAEYFLTDEPVATTRRIAEKLQPVMQNAVQAVIARSKARRSRRRSPRRSRPGLPLPATSSTALRWSAWPKWWLRTKTWNACAA